MAGAGRRRFEVVTTDTAVDQHLDLAGLDARSLQRVFTGDGCVLSHRVLDIPKAPLFDTCPGFELALWDVQLLVEGRELLLDVVGTNDMWSEFIPDGFDINLVVTHVCLIPC